MMTMNNADNDEDDDDIGDPDEDDISDPDDDDNGDDIGDPGWGDASPVRYGLFLKNEYFVWMNILDFKKMNNFLEWIFWI